ncbi:MAG: hypothetical protein PVI21_02485 [Candidatus Woesebacteria bacterium]|jgi:hypothetical protein
MTKKDSKKQDDDFKIKDNTADVGVDTQPSDAEEEARKIENEAEQPSVNPKNKSELVPDLESSQSSAPVNSAKSQKPKKFVKLRAFLKTKWGKVVIVLLSLFVVAGVLLAIPTTRYGILGSVIKKDVTLSVIDSETKKPVTEARIDLAGQSVTTDSDGNALFKGVSVGRYTATITKNYYSGAHAQVNVWILKNPEVDQVQLIAAGRQVPVKVMNTITKAPIENVAIVTSENSAKTDENGEAIIVLPAEKTEVDATISMDGYNELSTKVKVTEDMNDSNSFNLTPSGKVYFLSKRTGKLDVMKSNLDGTAAETVLAGTGNEEDWSTALIPSSDLKYLVLKARRENNIKLYLISTSNDSLSVIDDGNDKVSFNTMGWSDDRFVYLEYNGYVERWESGQNVIKSFDANSKKLSVIDVAAANGDSGNYAYEVYNNLAILKNSVVATKDWIVGSGSSSILDGKKGVVVAMNADGSNVRTLKEVDTTNQTLITKQYNTDQLIIRLNSGTAVSYFWYSDGSVTSAPNITDSDWGRSYPDYILAPNKQKTFWSESRDGKQTLLLGDSLGGNSTVLLSGVEYGAVGWYTDGYLLMSKDNSELYIMSVDGGNQFKMTDYQGVYGGNMCCGGGY